MKRCIAVLSLVSVFSFPILAGPEAAREFDLKNWVAPRYWFPAGVTRELSEDASGRKSIRIGPEAVASAAVTPLPFVPITPCRLADTRVGSGFPGQWGPPAIAGGGTQRTFAIAGQCGIPADAQAVSFNFAVWGPPTKGGLRVFPAGPGTPLVSTLNWEAGILALANAAVVALGAGGAITVQVDGPGTVDIFFDVNGYFSPPGAYSRLFAFGTVSGDGVRNTVVASFGTWTASRYGAGNYSVFFLGVRPGCTGLWPMMVVSSDLNGRFASGSAVVNNCLTGDVQMAVGTRSAADVAADSSFTFSAFSDAPALGVVTPAVRGWIPSTCTLNVSTGTETCE
jgi:hypothetical protein